MHADSYCISYGNSKKITLNQKLKYFGKVLENRHGPLITKWGTVSFFKNRNNGSLLANGNEDTWREVRLKIKLRIVLKVSEPVCAIKPGVSSQKDFESRRRLIVLWKAKSETSGKGKEPEALETQKSHRRRLLETVLNHGAETCATSRSRDWWFPSVSSWTELLSVFLNK